MVAALLVTHLRSGLRTLRLTTSQIHRKTSAGEASIHFLHTVDHCPAHLSLPRS